MAKLYNRKTKVDNTAKWLNFTVSYPVYLKFKEKAYSEGFSLYGALRSLVLQYINENEDSTKDESL